MSSSSPESPTPKPDHDSSPTPLCLDAPSEALDGMFIGSPPEARTQTADLLVEQKATERLERTFARLERFDSSHND